MSSDGFSKSLNHVPKGWDCKKLSECTTDGNISYGIVQPGQHVENGVPIIRVNNFSNGRLLTNDALRVSEEIESKFKRTKLKGGEVLLTLVGTTGQSAVVPNELSGWNIARAIAVIRPQPEIGPDWINLCLQTKEVHQFLNERANTTVQKTLNLSDVRDIPIIIPPERIKKQIESIAISLSEKIELNRQTNQTLEAIAQAIFKSWFVDFDPVKAKIAAKEAGASPADIERAAICAISGKSLEKLDQLSADTLQQLKATAALFPDALVESEWGLVPEGWGVVRFNQIVEKYIDNRGKTPPTTERGIPLLEVKHLPDGSIKPDLKTDKFVDEKTYNTWFRAHLEADDIIISTVGTIGRICMVPEGQKISIAQNLLGMRFDRKKASPYFMYYQMNDFRFRHDIDARLIITVQASIKRKDLETIDLLSPPIDLQKTFEKFINPFVAIQQSDQSLELVQLRDTLLPKLLAGELL